MARQIGRKGFGERHGEIGSGINVKQVQVEPRAKSQEEYLAELRKELARHAGIRHPFLKEIGSLNVEQLKVFASQFYLYVRMFPRLMGAAIYALPDESPRLALVLNLVNECGGLEHLERLDGSRSHPELFRKFTRALGINDKELEGTEPLESTARFIETYERFYLSSQPLKALGAVGPGTECAVPRMYVPILEGLRRQKRFSEEELEFFSLHLPVDEEHCEMICNSLLKYDRQWERDLIREGALEALGARKRFWDGLSAAIL